MSDQIERLLERVEKPVRYIGGEVNADVIPFEEAEITFAFAFPDTYEVAMSHLGDEDFIRNPKRHARCALRAGVHAVGGYAGCHEAGRGCAVFAGKPYAAQPV